MKILAMDASGLVASVAVTEDDRLIGEYTTNDKKTHSQTLLPMLDQLAGMIDLDLKTLDAIAVTSGPGSFTGLRIGAATVKGLGQALDIPLIPVPTLETLAYNCWGTDRLICPLMDARRKQAYTGLYQSADRRLTVLMDQAAMSIEAILERVNDRKRPVVFLGDGVPVFRQTIEGLCRVDYHFAPLHMAVQRASSLAALAYVYAQKGEFVAAEDFRPNYLRLSQAERERREKLAAEKRGSDVPRRRDP